MCTFCHTLLYPRWAEHNNQGVVCLDKLERAFQRGGKTPYCLEEVLQFCWNNGQVVDQSETRD